MIEGLFFCWRRRKDKVGGVIEGAIALQFQSSNQSPIIQSTLLPSLILLLLRKRIPKPKRFIPRACHNRLPIRTHSQI